ncbi:GbsR/MarR family transcriptional regulator [Caldalkalibacillus salinus]|uniref:GbsR/MarR family transcriptional regulator n=1 Tax=Caldalkalibacillus salinus TaxID=2803787 RepID=UPI001924D695|nr:GbsR/MarR family transcriptional regulator [Caldalkalibacillus salinus]
MQDNHEWLERKLDKARGRVIESISNNIDLYGVTPSIGRLYATMYFQDQPMTLDHMKQALGMSKTSMSTGVRTLSDLKMVEKVWQKGVRKDLYRVEEDWYQSLIDYFSIKWRKNIELNVKAAKKSRAEIKELIESNLLNDKLKKQAQDDLHKIEYALEYYDWLEDLVACFESEDIYQLVPKKRATDG